MLSSDDIVKAGVAVNAHLAKNCRNPITGHAMSWPTSAIAMAEGIARYGAEDKQAPFKLLRRLAESGCPCAFQGDAREVKRYGKTQVQRPWRWRECDPGDLDAWCGKVRAEPAKAGPYAAIEQRIRSLEARLATLEGSQPS